MNARKIAYLIAGILDLIYLFVIKPGPIPITLTLLIGLAGGMFSAGMEARRLVYGKIVFFSIILVGFYYKELITMEMIKLIVLCILLALILYFNFKDIRNCIKKGKNFVEDLNDIIEYSFVVTILVLKWDIILAFFKDNLMKTDPYEQVRNIGDLTNAVDVFPFVFIVAALVGIVLGSKERSIVNRGDYAQHN